MRQALGLILLAVLCVSPALPQQKRRVAVLDFDYSTVQSDVQKIFQTNTDIGKGISDLLVSKLLQGGVYSVYERKALDKVLAEQNFSNSDRADVNSAVKLGRLMGVDAIITGSITKFGRDDRQTNIGGGALGRVTGRYGIGGVGTKKSMAVVGISARLINTETGEILSAVEGFGDSTRSGTGLLGEGGGNFTAGGNVDMRSSNFANTIIGEAIGKAVNDLGGKLNQQATLIPAKVVKVEGLVADASGNTLVLNIGSRAGLKVGDRLTVLRSGREIKDPATGKVLRRFEDKIGEVTLTDVDDKSAVGNYSGSAPAKVSDVVRN